ncbi:hypothetical protein GCM10009534_69570 [Kribbella sandramycini]
MLAAALILTGCSTADAKDIRTSGIRADFVVTVKDRSRGADVRGTLRAGTLTYVKLGDGESLHVTGGTASTDLRHSKSLGVTSYLGRLDGEQRAGTEITFDLRRDSENQSAPRSTVVLPERLQLTAPAIGTTASRKSPLAVRFDSAPTDLPTTVHWSGPCIQDGELRLPSGAVGGQIPANAIRLAATPSPGQPGVACTIKVKVFRQAIGVRDPAFKDGTVIAEAQSTRELTSIS